MVGTKTRVRAGIHYAIYAFATYCLLSIVVVPLATPFTLSYILEMFLVAGGGSALVTGITVMVFWPRIQGWSVGGRACAITGCVFLLFVIAASGILLLADGDLYSIPFAFVVGIPVAGAVFVGCLLAGKLSANVAAFRIAVVVSALAFIAAIIAVLT